MKQQLQREQLQELEQQQQNQQQNQQQQQTAALKVPLQSIGVDVPPQVLQVRTVLENPTRYHVIQKQKTQVRQYLSESFQQSQWSDNGSSYVSFFGGFFFLSFFFIYFFFLFSQTRNHRIIRHRFSLTTHNSLTTAR